MSREASVALIAADSAEGRILLQKLEIRDCLVYQAKLRERTQDMSELWLLGSSFFLQECDQSF